MQMKDKWIVHIYIYYIDVYACIYVRRHKILLLFFLVFFALEPVISMDIYL